MITGTAPPLTPRTNSLSAQSKLTDREARLARAFPGKPVPTESKCRPLFRYLNGRCPFDDPHSPDASAGKAMLKYCMDIYGSLGPLRQVMDDHPFTLKVKLSDYGDGSAAAVLDELARWNIPCDVEAVIGNQPDHLASFLGHALCNVRTLTVHCGEGLDEKNVKSLGSALESCPSLKNFELVAVDPPASSAVTTLLEALAKKPLESLTILANFSRWSAEELDLLIRVGTKMPRFNACLDTQACGYVLSQLTGQQPPGGWELQLCDWKPQVADRRWLQLQAANMLASTKGMTHAGLAFFSPFKGNWTFGKDCALLTFNTLQSPSALPPDLQSLFVRAPEEKNVLGHLLAPRLASNRAAHFNSEGFVPGALGMVPKAAAAANGYPMSPDVAKHIGAYVAGAGEVSRQEAVQYAMVSKATYRAAMLESDKVFLDWLVTAWKSNRVNPDEVAVGLAATPFRLSSAFRGLAVERLGSQQGKELADAMAKITVQETPEHPQVGV
jgi:hypothetical protein